MTKKTIIGLAACACLLLVIFINVTGQLNITQQISLAPKADLYVHNLSADPCPCSGELADHDALFVKIFSAQVCNAGPSNTKADLKLTYTDLSTNQVKTRTIHLA